MNSLLLKLASLLTILTSLLGLRQTPLATSALTINETKIIVEIADTDSARAHGLSDRPALGENQGMLFVFDVAGYPSFWMKNMRFPLDIIWLDDNWRVIDLTENISPQDFPKIYQPRAPTRYVLEVNAGFIAAHHITVMARIPLATKLSFTRSP